MRTAGLLYGAVRGLFAAGTPHGTAAGRSAAPSWAGRRYDAGAALFVKAVGNKGETDGYRACVQNCGHRHHRCCAQSVAHPGQPGEYASRFRHPQYLGRIRVTTMV